MVGSQVEHYPMAGTLIPGRRRTLQITESYLKSLGIEEWVMMPGYMESPWRYLRHPTIFAVHPEVERGESNG